MRRSVIFVYKLLLVFLTFGSCEAQSLPQDKGDDAKAIVPLGDPFILLHDDVYYAYGTQSPDGIVVYVSTDLVHWSIPDLSNGNLALHKDDVWGDRWFWAPEVYYINNRFYMYYSADEHICVATSDSPLGPFKQDNKMPIIADEKSIDNSLFIDDDGVPYMYFVRFNDGNNIWVGEMTDDLLHLKMETLSPCIHVSQEWEKVWPRVNEGPFIVKHNDLYYMTYSANSFESQMYGVGFATADNPRGPWTKYEGNPVLQSPGDLVGAGHSALFHDKKGQLMKVYHAHNSQQNIHPRRMYISGVNFQPGTNGIDVMTIDVNYITPFLISDQ